MEVVEATAPIEFALVGDRIHATITSGGCRQTYAFKPHLALLAANAASKLLADRPSNVCQMERHG